MSVARGAGSKLYRSGLAPPRDGSDRRVDRARGRAGEGWRRRGAGSRATRARNELGVRWVLGVWRSGGEIEGRAERLGVALRPAWEDSACDDDRRAIGGLRRGWRGTDGGGRMGGGLMCAPSMTSAMTKDGGAGASVGATGADANSDSATGIARII